MSLLLSLLAFGGTTFAPLPSFAQEQTEDLYASAISSYQNAEYALAFSLAEVAAGRGHGEAAKLAGVLHEKGLVPGADDATAAAFLRQAGELTADADVFMQLGYMGRAGRGGLDGMHAEGFFRRAAESGGGPAARYELGLLFLEGALNLDQDLERGRQIMQATATAGYAPAQRAVGLLLIEGRGGPRDIEAGVQWLELAVEAGDAEAAYAAGVYYSDGTMTAPDDLKAAEYFRRAAKRGHGRAAAQLGVMAMLGAGVQAAPDEAAQWFRQAAEAGDPLGRYYWALSLAKGDGVTRDLAASYRWVILSEAGGPLDTPADEADRTRLREALEAVIPEEMRLELRASAVAQTGLTLRR